MKQVNVHGPDDVRLDDVADPEPGPRDAVVRVAARRAVPLLVINRDESPFTELASNLQSGHFVQGAAGEVMPALAEILLEQS